jgi:hypothetical protein
METGCEAQTWSDHERTRSPLWARRVPHCAVSFDDCEVSVGPGTTTLRAELPDQSALYGLMQRISGLGLELLDPPPGVRCGR